jgi:opacity protein-like surface antigen
MKKLITLALLALTINASAQFTISLRDGISLPVIASSNGVDYKPSMSYMPEIGIGYSFGDFSVNTGIQFTWIDFYAEVGNWYYWTDQTLQWQYDYVGIPLFASYKHNFDKLYIGADLGALFMLNTSADFFAYYTVYDPYDPYYPYQDYVYSKQITQATSFIPMLLAGIKVGYDFSDHFSMDLIYRYNYAFEDVEQSYRSIPSVSSRIHANSLMFGLNYKF